MEEADAPPPLPADGPEPARAVHGAGPGPTAPAVPVSAATAGAPAPGGAAAAPQAATGGAAPAGTVAAPPGAAGAQPAASGKLSIDQFKQVELRVATVKAAEAIPKSQKLLKLTVDLGDETRTVVAGIALAYRPEELVGRQVVMVANLQPAKLMGVESHGMVLAATVGQDDRPVLLHPSAAVPNGSRVR